MMIIQIKPFASKNERLYKKYYGQTKWMNFLIEDDDILGKNMLFGIKSALILKKNSIANLSIIIFFLNTNIKAYIDKATITNLSIITSFEYKNKSLH